MIKWRGAWAHVNGLFGRCKRCGALAIRGICQACGHAVQCAWCKRVRMPDGSMQHVMYADSGETSHTICNECTETVKKEIVCQK